MHIIKKTQDIIDDSTGVHLTEKQIKLIGVLLVVLIIFCVLVIMTGGSKSDPTGTTLPSPSTTAPIFE